MVYLVYDQSFEGLLTAVFEVYERRLTQVHIRKNNVPLPQLFTEAIEVVSDEKKCARVWQKLNALLGKEGLQTLWKVWLSELDGIEDSLLAAMQYAIARNENILGDYGNPHVMRIQQTLKSVGREKHRMEAFVRFMLTADNLYYAAIDPDFNVLPLIAPHFESRYGSQRWMIYDIRRQYGIYYDLNTCEVVQLADGAKPVQNFIPQGDDIAENELLYQALWQDYFTNTNIKARRNIKLHTQHVPRRYWKYLTEKTMRR